MVWRNLCASSPRILPEIERPRSNGNGRKSAANGHANNGEAVEVVEKKPEQ